MGKEYIPLFLDFNETTQDLTDEECGRLIRAVVDYANEEDYEKRLTGGERIAFRFLKGLVDRNAAISEARAKAAMIKAEQSSANVCKAVQSDANACKAVQSDAKSITKTKTDTKTDTKTKKQDMFDRFWAAYPRHDTKAEARKVFDRLNPDENLLAVMLAAIEQQKKGNQWSDPRYIPQPRTWLNQRRWEDEPQRTVHPKPLSAQQYEQRDYSGEDSLFDVLSVLQGDMMA